MDTWQDLHDAARQEPDAAARVVRLARAAEVADSVGDLDGGFACRIELVEATYHSGDAVEALAAFAWLQARLDAEPERFAEDAQRVAWCHKWMPGAARRHPAVRLDAITGLIDDLERRHVDAGAGRRQAVALRMTLAQDAGVGEPLGELLAQWHEAERSSLTDCPACEVRLEAETLIALGRGDEALAVLEPFLTGEIPACAEGPTPNCRLAVEPLLDQQRVDHASEVFRIAVRSGRNERRHLGDVAALASLLARTGDPEGARTMTRSLLVLLDQEPTAEPVMDAAADLARALAPSDPDRLVTDAAVAALGPTPEGGWTAGPLRRRLAEVATDLAARFDARNGTSTVGDRIRAALDAEDRAPASLRGRQLRMPVDPDVVLADIPIVPAPPVSVPEVLVPTPEEGAAAFQRWAFDRMDRWQAPAVHDACVARWEDPALPADLRAAAAFWILGGGAAVDPAEIVTVVEAAGGGLPVDLRAALHAEIATTLLGSDESGDRAAEHAHRSLDLLEGTTEEVEARQVLAALRNVVEVLLAVGDVDGAERAMTLVRRQDPGPEAGTPAAVLAALALLTMTEAEVLTGADEESLDDLRLTVDRLALAAERALAVGGYPVAAHGLIEVARRHLGLEEPAAAVDALHRAGAVIPGGPGTAPMRVQVGLMLADAVGAVDGPAAALVPQRTAIDAAREIGVAPLEGWGRRGLGYQLLALGRAPEAIVQFAEAADLMAEGDDPLEVWQVRLSQARAEFDNGDPVRAGDLADLVLTETAAALAAGAPIDALRDVVIDASDLASDVAWLDDDAIAAERHLVRLADLLSEAGRPAALARSNAARGAAMAGAADRAEALFERSLEELPTDDEAARAHAHAVVLGRRGEVRWWADRNDEAAADADEGYELAETIGDDLLASRILAMGARARHDAYRAAAAAVVDGTGDPADSLRAGRDAEDALIHAIQRSQAVDDDQAAEELGARLADVRELQSGEQPGGA